MLNIGILILCFLVFNPQAFASDIRLRLREHYESHQVDFGFTQPDTANYTGFSNTANLWFEDPFIRSIGISFSPILGISSVNGTPPIGTDSKARFWNIGLEYKHFFLPGDPGPFFRLGASLAILDTRGAIGSLLGFGTYGGVGWEFLIWKIGIAPELAIRPAFYEQGVRSLSFLFSVGFHFYVLADDDSE